MAQSQTTDYDIFISYAWKDGHEQAEQLERDLKQAGFRVWRDRNIRKSADFTAEIERAIRAAKLLVVVMTQSIENSDESYVRNEIGYAEIKKKPRIVARFHDAIILPLARKTWIEFWNSTWEIKFPELVQTIKTEIDLLNRGIEAKEDLPQVLQDDPYRQFAKDAYELAVNYIEQTTIFRQEIDLIARPDPERVGKITSKSGGLRQAFKRMNIEHQSKPELESLADAMREYEGRVLLLGEPGAGKTTSLMALTRDLASKRMSDPKAPLPLFAFCSGWKASPPQPIHEWLAGENDIPVDEMKRMISAGEVVLVLDGLDELGSSQIEKQKIKDENGKDKEITFDPRKRFIEAILAEGKIVISTRIEDYERIGDKLTTLNGAITLQNLTDAQLQNYLADLPALWDVLKSDTDLLEIARTPLLLSVIAYGFRDAPEAAQSLKDLTTSYELRNAIFQTYINRRYEHERVRLETMRKHPPFTLEKIYEVLGHVAMINASGGLRRGPSSKDWREIYDNVLFRRDFNEKLYSRKVTPFIQYCIKLNFLVEVENELRFIHLRLRDMLVSYYCTFERVFDEQLYTQAHEPNPAIALGNIKEGLNSCLELLNSYVKSEMRQSAAEALGAIGGDQALSALTQALQTDIDSSVRWSSAKALEQIGDEQTVPALIQALQADSVSIVRQFSAKALGAIGGDQALSALMYALQTDIDSSVRWSVSQALHEIGEEKSVTSLLHALQYDNDADVRLSVTATLGNIGSNQSTAILINTLRYEKDPDVRLLAVWALGQVRNNLAINPLLFALQHDENSNLRGIAADALLRYGDENILASILKSPYELKNMFEEDVKSQAAEKLEKIGTPTALEAVRKWRESQK